MLKTEKTVNTNAVVRKLPIGRPRVYLFFNELYGEKKFSLKIVISDNSASVKHAFKYRTFVHFKRTLSPQSTLYLRSAFDNIIIHSFVQSGTLTINIRCKAP